MSINLPANAQLIISGPAFVSIGSVPQAQPVPVAQPMVAPQQVPQPVPQAVPQEQPTMYVPAFQPTFTSWGGYAPVPQATMHAPAVHQGYAPAYASPQQMPLAPQQVPMRVPTPMHQSAPAMDPAKQAMADYIAARMEAHAHAQMQKELDTQIAKAETLLEEAGIIKRPTKSEPVMDDGAGAMAGAREK